jgi:uncharacterized Zn finger protein
MVIYADPDGGDVTTSKEPPELNTRIFTKGLAIYESGKVKPDGESDRTVYFIVEGDHEPHKIRLSSDGTFSCTCMRGTLHGASKGSVCSHVFAAMLFLSERSRKKDALD